VNGLPEVLDTLRHLDKGIDELQSQRSELTGRLERLAHTWDERYPPRAGEFARLACTSCRFRYMDTTETVVRFGTDCTWCGREGGLGIEIPIAWMNRALQDGDES